MGTPNFFLGMEIHYLREHGVVSLSQKSYIAELGTEVQLPFRERATSPIKADYYAKLQASADEPILADKPYKELVGSLIYVKVCTGIQL